MKIPDNMVPLVYVAAAAIIAGGLYAISVPAEVIGMIVGAALTRVKVSTSTAETKPTQ